MKKQWEELTAPEKIEDVRADVKRLFVVANDLNEAITAVSFRLTGAVNLLSEVAAAVKKLEKR
jgi:hypothetical protein